MTPSQRNIKRLVIISIYLAILLLVGTGLYFLLRTAPTCSDKIQNQGEEGIDCGGPCAACETLPDARNLETAETAIVPGEGGRYDALAKITNPNSQFGAAKFGYVFSLLDQSGKVLAKSEGESFVLPGQTKYILAFNMDASEKPASVKFEVRSFEWDKLKEYKEPDIPVYSKQFNLSSGGESGFANLKAKIKNQSDYDFRTITADVVIRNGAGTPIAINETNFNDVRANEEREINLTWNSSFPIDPVSARIEIVPEANVFDNDNFMKQHGVSGQYGTYDPDVEPQQ
ncbi:MAG: hypothetical protein PHF35_02940 [Candidatus Moranbacteria bacterium]|nr:hypothetical protein [Candidatus Moranbacteria bacterium]